MAPDVAVTLDSRGYVYLKRNDLDLAIADYTAALSENPKLASSLYGRGKAKKHKGDNAGGDADIAAAKALDPKIAETFAHIGIN